MITVFFNNQNYTTMRLHEAKELITSSTKETLVETYLECWRSITPVSDKVKLEKWWMNNKDAFKLREEKQGENKEVFELTLTPEQDAMNEDAELDLVTEKELS